MSYGLNYYPPLISPKIETYIIPYIPRFKEFILWLILILSDPGAHDLGMSGKFQVDCSEVGTDVGCPRRPHTIP